MKTITYLLTNTQTGDEYVGVTSDRKGLKNRMYHHKARAKKGSHNHLPLYANINQYGWDKITWRVLSEGNREKEWCYLLNPSLNQCWVGRKPISQKQVEATRKARSRPVMCVETGVTYPSATAAEQALGLCRSINAVCMGKRNTAGGFRWILC